MSANKKFFRANPNLAEFAKPLPPIRDFFAAMEEERGPYQNKAEDNAKLNSQSADARHNEKGTRDSKSQRGRRRIGAV